MEEVEVVLVHAVDVAVQRPREHTMYPASVQDCKKRFLRVPTQGALYHFKTKKTWQNQICLTRLSLQNRRNRFSTYRTM